MTRLELRRGRNRHQWGLGLKLELHAYDGLVVELAIDALSCWLIVRLRLLTSERMLQRAWDRWAAESLAGEHRGIGVTISPSPT